MKEEQQKVLREQREKGMVLRTNSELMFIAKLLTKICDVA